MRKPFYRKSHKSWYVKDDAGQFVRLDSDEEKAFDLWHQMRARSQFEPPDSPISGTCEAWVREHADGLSKDRLAKIVSFCDSLCEFLGPRTQTRKIARQDVRRWLDAPRTIRGKDKQQWSAAVARTAAKRLQG